MNSLRWCCPRVPVPDPEIGRRLGNDPGGASDVEAPRCEKLLAGFRLCGMRPEASRDSRRTPQGPACQGWLRLVPLQDWAAQPAPGLEPGAEDVRLAWGHFSRRVVGKGSRGSDRRARALEERHEMGEELAGGPVAVVSLAVNEERRRAVHAAARAGEEVGADLRHESRGVDVPVKSIEIESQPVGMLAQVAVVQLVLVLVEQVVHLPELVLQAGRLRRLRGAGRVRMRLSQGKVAEGEAQIAAQLALQSLHDRVGLSAVRALVVAVLDQGDARVGRAVDVIAGTERRMQAAHRFFSFWFLVRTSSKAWRAPSAPGLMPMGDR